MRVLCLGAGGAPTNGFCRALKAADTNYHLIGANANGYDLELAETDERHPLPKADDAAYDNALFWLLNKTKPDFVHAQNDAEVEAISRLRHVIRGHGCRYYLPSHQTILICRDKWASYEKWAEAGVKVPHSYPFDGHIEGRILSTDSWLRPRVGAGGRGAFKVEARQPIPSMGREWMVSEYLPGPTVTVQALYHRGSLVVSQGRRRLAWTHGDRGSALVSETVSEHTVDVIAENAVLAVDPEPHGLYGVDMTYDQDGVPNPTEINIGRFFTTVPEFFQQAGFNIADLYVRVGAYGHVLSVVGRNPLPPGLKWIRGMDRSPVLV